MKNSVSKLQVFNEFVKKCVLSFPVVLITTNNKPNLIASHVTSTVVTVLCLGFMPWMAPVLMENMSK